MPDGTRQAKKKQYMPFAVKVLRFIFSKLGPLAPGFFGQRAFELWFSTQRYKTPQKELPAKSAAATLTLDMHGLPVMVYRWGEGSKKILFVHGWSGRGTQCAFFIEPLINAGYQVISFDSPAHGESPGERSSILQFSDTLIKLEENHGPFDAAITHSFGGMALAYAMRFGMEINRVVSICPPDDIRTLLKNFQTSLAIPDVVMNVVDTAFYATHGYSLRDRVSTVNNVKRLSNKALIIHDEDDSELHWSCGKNVADAWPGARFIKTSGLGHRRIIRDPRVVKTAIDFITGQQNAPNEGA